MLNWREATEADAAFLGELDASLSGWMDAVAGLADEQRQALLAMQARAREQAYRTAWPEARCQIIEAVATGHTQPLGRVWTARRDGQLHLLDISLLPTQRAQGVGSQCLQRLIAQAQAAGLDLTLEVAEDNPALRLYRRLGFAVVAHHPPYLSMCRAAGAGTATTAHPVETAPQRSA